MRDIYISVDVIQPKTSIQLNWIWRRVSSELKRTHCKFGKFAHYCVQQPKDHMKLNRRKICCHFTRQASRILLIPYSSSKYQAASDNRRIRDLNRAA